MTGVNKPIVQDQLDQAWLAAIRDRRAILWLGAGLANLLGPDFKKQASSWILSRTWAAVYVDDCTWATADIDSSNGHEAGLVPRVFAADPGVHLPPNRLPIYLLPTSIGGLSEMNARDKLARFKMLERAPAGCELIVVGVEDQEMVDGVLEAIQVSQGSTNLVFISEDACDISSLTAHSERVVIWTTGRTGIDSLIAQSAPPERGQDSVILVHSRTGNQAVDIGSAIDDSYPITSAFELIPAVAAMDATPVTESEVEAFLADPTASWRAFSKGIPYPRHRTYREALLKKLIALRKQGWSAGRTCWIPAEDGSGATTVLRHVCLDLARAGYPVLVARPDIDSFDRQQLSVFLTQASDRFNAEGLGVSDLPWVIAFDSQHVLSGWEFLKGLCNSLKQLRRSVIVVAVRPSIIMDNEQYANALGQNTVLGEVLRNSVSIEEASGLGQHLSTLLPTAAARTKNDWVQFVDDTKRTTLQGSRSLFWVALRFWLSNLPGAEMPLRKWLATKVATLTDDDAATLTALMETAALASFRLNMPALLLDEQDRKAASRISMDTSNPIGFRRIVLGPRVSYTFSHPMIAEELLRIGSGDARTLKLMGKTTCESMLDFELHMIRRLIARESAGTEACVPVIEALVTSGLRVDPRAAPRNYGAREAIVDVLEAAPDSLWDVSQVFNHHVARARRYLAIDPPGDHWDIEARREQLELAVNHLLDAIQYIEPANVQDRESPLNLQVSLALTYVACAGLEDEAGQTEAASDYRKRAERHYQNAQVLDADNSYVLENYARLKLRRANVEEDAEERTILTVEAIALLEMEQELDESQQRAEPILIELGTAYEILEAGSGRAALTDLASRGSEAAALALVHLALKDVGEAWRAEGLAEAEESLKHIPPAAATWRSKWALYRIVRELTPRDFVRRLDVLEELEAFKDFAWPQQIRLEYAILLHQVGDHYLREKGLRLFKDLRAGMARRSGAMRVPDELRFLSDPANEFATRLRTSMRVLGPRGQYFEAIPEGWANYRIPFRQYLFGSVSRDQERDCFVEFSPFGPLAVPTTTPE